ncbi:chloroplast small heat shock protein [Iris pallida]|uniref:Chloroplast small heat shock protein n=1 Tax=Iris pallida TaxID=29817 RepID=A0AAX6I4C5_IRIPA|nr:chloroplast small heat shock protein [Iris pallida]
MALARLCIRNSPLRHSPLLFNTYRLEEAQRLLNFPAYHFSSASTSPTSNSAGSSSSPVSTGQKDHTDQVTVSKESSPSRRRQRRRGQQLWKQPWNLAPFQLNNGLGSFGNALRDVSENLNKLLENWVPSRLLGRVKEDDESYKFRFPVPGMSKEDIKITVVDRHLTVTAEHKEEEEGSDDDDEKDSWYFQKYGYYNTSLLLPDDAKVEDIKAEVKNGLLYVTVPRSGERKRDVREIEIK